MKYPMTFFNIFLIVIYIVVFCLYLYFNEIHGRHVYISQIPTMLSFTLMLLGPHVLFIIWAHKKRGSIMAQPILFISFLALGAGILTLNLMSDDVAGFRFLLASAVGWVGCLICWVIQKSLGVDENKKLS